MMNFKEYYVLSEAPTTAPAWGAPVTKYPTGAPAATPGAQPATPGTQPATQTTPAGTPKHKNDGWVRKGVMLTHKIDGKEYTVAHADLGARRLLVIVDPATGATKDYGYDDFDLDKGVRAPQAVAAGQTKEAKPEQQRSLGKFAKNLAFQDIKNVPDTYGKSTSTAATQPGKGVGHAWDKAMVDKEGEEDLSGGSKYKV